MKLQFFYHDHSRFKIEAGDFIGTDGYLFKPPVYFKVIKVNNLGYYCESNYRFDIPEKATVHRNLDCGLI